MMLTREVFLSRFRADGECHVWTGGRNAEGYGVVRVSGVCVYTHVLAWETHTGKPVPPGQLVLHRCDNPPCGNPAHLKLGEHGDNLADQWHRKRRKARARGHG